MNPVFKQKRIHVAARVKQPLHDSLGSRGVFQNAGILPFVSPETNVRVNMGGKTTSCVMGLRERNANNEELRNALSGKGQGAMASLRIPLQAS